MRRGEAGAVALEFALMLPIALMIVAALLFTGFYALVSGVAQNAAREAARFASVPVDRDPYPVYPSAGAVKERAAEVVPGLVSAADISVDVASNPVTPTPGVDDIVTVTVTFEHVGVLSAVGDLLSAVGLDGVATVTRSATARRE